MTMEKWLSRQTYIALVDRRFENNKPEYTYTIHHYAKKIISQSTGHKSIANFTNHQIMRKLLNVTKIISRLMSDCAFALNELGDRSKVTLAWVSGQEYIESN